MILGSVKIVRLTNKWWNKKHTVLKRKTRKTVKKCCRSRTLKENDWKIRHQYRKTCKRNKRKRHYIQKDAKIKEKKTVALYEQMRKK